MMRAAANTIQTNSGTYDVEILTSVEDRFFSSQFM